MKPILAILISYLLGSIPFGYLIVRASRGDDIRETGSGGTGATNVSRRAGKLAGVFTLLLDALKGAAAIVIAKSIVGIPVLQTNIVPRDADTYWWITGAAIAVILGHMFPVWLGFRGGKGVATAIGVFLLLASAALALAGVLFLLIVLLTRYISLGSIVSAATLPLFVVLQNYLWPSVDFTPVVAAAIVIGVLIVFAHRANVSRLIAGTESRFR